MSDLESRVRAGDAAAFGAYIREHDRRMRGIAWAVVRDRHRTDDVMQAAYEKAFRSLDRFDGRSSLSTWLHSIIYHAALDNLRYEGRRRHDDVDDLDWRAPAGPDAADSVVGQSELAAVLDQLNPADRAALMLTVGYGYSYDEAAEILGERRGTVAARVSRARDRVNRWEES